MKRATETDEARRKVGDLDACSVARDENGFENAGVANVARRCRDLPFELDVAEALLLVTREKPAEYRVSVQSRKTSPDDPPARLNECRDAAVADGRHVER